MAAAAPMTPTTLAAVVQRELYGNETLSDDDEAKKRSARRLKVDEAREVFSLFDPQATGSIPLTELGAVVRALGKRLTEDELDELINIVDSDASSAGSSVDFAAFWEMLSATSLADCEPRAAVVRHFDVFDANHNGRITKMELIKILKVYGEPLNDDDAEHLMGELDELVDGDGNIEVAALVDLLASTSGYDDVVVAEAEPMR